MDYKELIRRLYQHNENYGQGRTQDFFRVCLDCKEAATAITDLLARAEKAESERDAAVEMLKKANDETGNCYGCKYFYAKKQVCTDKEKKIVCDCGENNMWEWRGPQKEE